MFRKTTIIKGLIILLVVGTLVLLAYPYYPSSYYPSSVEAKKMGVIQKSEAIKIANNYLKDYLEPEGYRISIIPSRKNWRVTKVLLIKPYEDYKAFNPTEPLIMPVLEEEEEKINTIRSTRNIPEKIPIVCIEYKRWFTPKDYLENIWVYINAESKEVLGKGINYNLIKVK